MNKLAALLGAAACFMGAHAMCVYTSNIFSNWRVHTRRPVLLHGTAHVLRHVVALALAAQ